MAASAIAVSVLDLIPVRTGQTTAEAIVASRHLAQVADQAGARRYWVAEHHNTESVAATSPPVLIALLAAGTERMRLGSGGVMLPNHSPLAVAEQFAALEAAFPGRIDMGIGRAPGTDPVTSWALRGGAVEEDVVQRFPAYVQQVIAFLTSEGAAVKLGGRSFGIRATPRAVGTPPVWLLGSSDYSAKLAAELGLPYVFAHHFSGLGTADALALYRREFAGPGAPRTFLTVNAVVADSAKEASALAGPFQHTMARLRTGRPLGPLLTVEEAARTAQPLSEKRVGKFAQSWFLGTADQVADGVRKLAAAHAVDEVMVQPIAGSYDDDQADRTPARERTIRELVAALG